MHLLLKIENNIYPENNHYFFLCRPSSLETCGKLGTSTATDRHICHILYKKIPQKAKS